MRLALALVLGAILILTLAVPALAQGAPAITDISPAKASPGQAVDVVITGENLGSADLLFPAESRITISGVQSSAAQITGRFTTSSSSEGLWQLTVMTPGGSTTAFFDVTPYSSCNNECNPAQFSCQGTTRQYCGKCDADLCYDNCQETCPAAGTASGTTCYYGSQQCSATSCGLSTCTLSGTQTCNAAQGCAAAPPPPPAQDTTKPASTITSPASGSTQRADFPVSVTDADNVRVDKCSYRIESNSQDTTFRNTASSLMIKTDNNQDNIQILSGCRDVNYQFNVEKAPPGSTIKIFFTAKDNRSEKVSSTEPRTITKCDGTPSTPGSFADSRGWFIISLTTDADGKGAGRITSKVVPEDHGAYLYEAYVGDTTSSIAKDTLSVQDTNKPPPYFWAQRTCSTPIAVKLGSNCPDQSTLPVCTVHVRANDTSGNVGDSAGAIYAISFLSSTITAPAAGSTQSANFKIAVKDEDSSGSGLKKCEYRVISKGATTIDWTARTCNAEQEIPVKTDGCKDAGTNACEIQARAETNSGVTGNIASVKVSIDFEKPVTSIQAISGWIQQNFEVQISDTDPSGTGLTKCEYKVVSGATNTKPWTTRTCNAAVTVTVSSTGDCRNEGGNKCTVFARSAKGSLQSAEVNQSYNILLTPVTDANGFSSITTTTTSTGLRFTAVPKTTISLPIYRICNAGASTGECINTFNAGSANCGLGKACLCGSLTSYSCDVRCSEKNLQYYGLVTGSGGTTIISPVASVTCPKTAAGEIEDMIAYFMLLDAELTKLIGEADVLCRTGTAEEKAEFCPRVDALQQAQAIVRDHLEWLDSIKSNPTQAQLQEARSRSGTVRNEVANLMSGAAATTLSLDMTIPTSARINDTVTIPATIVKSGNLTVYAQMNCTLTKPSGRQVRNISSCIDVNIPPIPPPPLSATGSLIASTPYTFEFLADESGNWSLTCKLQTAFRSDCSNSFEEDRASGIIEVIRRIKSVITSIEVPVTAVKGSPAQVSVNAENPDIADIFALASCRVTDPNNVRTTQKSSCQLIGAGQEQTLNINFIVPTAGTWAVDRCSLNASSQNNCLSSSTDATSQQAKTFEVVVPSTLIITSMQLPANPVVDKEATANATVENDIDDMYALVSCSADTPNGTVPLRSGCEFLNKGDVRKMEMKFIPTVNGLWNVTSCTVSASNDACQTVTPQQTINNAGTFNVTGGRLLSASGFTSSQQVTVGAQASVSAQVKNPTANLIFGYLTCSFRTPSNILASNSSTCMSFASGASAASRVLMTASSAGLWSVESCAVKGSYNSNCANATTHFVQNNIGEFTATSGPSAENDLRIVAARAVGNVFRGQYAGTEIEAKNPAADKYALATCSYTAPSGAIKTGNSQCARIAGSSQRNLTAQVLADEAGTWSTTSCTLKASSYPDCSQAVANDTKNNIGTFNVTVPASLFVAQITARDAANNSNANITAKISNPLTDNRFAVASCSVRKPSGISINLSSGCTGVAAGSSKDFTMLTIADEIGTWRVSECSVFESTSSSCSAGNTVHTVQGQEFAVFRAANISFTSGLSLPESVQNNSIMTISSTALNPSQADIFARMMCIFMPPGQQQNIVANSSCFAIAGETGVPVGVNLLVNKVGQWDLVSCSMLGSLDSGCADQTVHATNATGGTFVSVAVPVLNLSIISASMTSTVITGGDAEINAAAGNANNFPQYANMMCSIRNPGGSEENLTSQCKRANASGAETFQITKTVNELGTWNVTLCRLFASTSANCTGAVLQNSTAMGTFEVVLPTNLIIRNAFGNNALNSSFTNITAIIENPLSERKYALVACDVTSPAGRNSSSAACTGLESNQVKYLNFTLFVDETGTWKIPRCSINASNSFDCAGSQSHNNATGGTFSVASRTNLTFVSATVPSSSVFIGSSVEVQASVRNPSQTDLFGKITCSFSTSAGTRQNLSSCTLFRAGTVVAKNVNIGADVLGIWTAGTCAVSGTLDSSCAQSAQHDTINIPAPVNVTTVPDLVITNVEVPEGINRNTTGLANVQVRNDGLPIFAIATCSIRSPTKTITNSSGCQAINAETSIVPVPFFVDRLGNWSVFGCSVNGSANSTCVPSRVHNTSNITRMFNATGRVLQIEEILKPESGIKVGDRVEVIVRVKNVDDVTHKGFVNCTLRQPTNQSKEITSSVQTVNADETKLFRPSFIAELSGQWRLRTCTVYRTESPIFKEDEKTIEEIFSVSTVSRPPPSPAACTINTECPSTDLKCYCSVGECRACPVGTTCRNYACESTVTPQCTFDPDCPLGFQCRSGTCIETVGISCTFDTDCPLRQQCDRGTCVQKPAECITDDQCLPSYACISGQCQQQAAPDQTIINLILIALAAIIIAVGLLFILRRRLAGHDIYSEIEGKK